MILFQLLHPCDKVEFLFVLESCSFNCVTTAALCSTEKCLFSSALMKQMRHNQHQHHLDSLLLTVPNKLTVMEPPSAE